jgi:hypothetical protein
MSNPSVNQPYGICVAIRHYKSVAKEYSTPELHHHPGTLPMVPPPPTVLIAHSHILCPNTFQRDRRVTCPDASRDARGSRRFSRIVNPAKSSSISSGST